jgi:hypothetical protein
MAFVTRALDANGDIALRDGKSYLITGEAAISQSAKTRLRLFLGEWFLNLSEGVPYYREVFVKNPSIPVITAIFRRALLACPGVSSVIALSVTVDPRTRKATVNGTVKIDTGATITLEPFVI